MNIRIEQLQEQDATTLFEFECNNRDFFERIIASRGNDYYVYENYEQILKELIAEQTRGESYFHLIKDDSNKIIGRVNLVNIDKINRTGEVGYRIGEEYGGRGIATKALSLMLKETEYYGVDELRAMVTHHNPASQHVLSKNNFVKLHTDKNAIEFNGEKYDLVHFKWRRT
ncbi:GNAT family N-acetyltransferase [Bacillus solimangrovi]|uniref:N-acetyltransferase domain-containing protein n=1 Tax=Bacillus solimangrovi TaxID=1305675 RepID=A0A1E5LKC2_9BACI|nr:GNAT family protein [Bacillus solimangrovi]OEH94537.1 hypothetical protein BFG57_07660 [Bacillus solimangrovi]